MTRAILFLMLAVLAVPAWADGDRRPGGRESNERPNGDHTDIQRARNRSELRRAIFKKMSEKFLDELKEESPDKYKELMRLKEENPDKFMQQVREMIQNRMKERGFPKGRGEHANDDPEHPLRPEGGHGPGMHGGPGGLARRKMFSEKFLNHLKEKRPQDFERLQKLRRENPEEARMEIKKFYGGFDHKYFRPDDKIPALIHRLRAAQTDEDRTKAQTELQEALKNAFDQRLKSREEYLDQLAKKLEEMRKQIAEYRSRKDEMCNKRYQQILDDVAPPQRDTPIRKKPTSDEKRTDRERERPGTDLELNDRERDGANLHHRMRERGPRGRGRQ